MSTTNLLLAAGVLVAAVLFSAGLGFILGRRTVSRDAAATQALADRFAVLATQVLDEKRASVIEQNQQSLGAMLAPLRTELDGFRKQVAESVHSTAARHGELAQQLNQLAALNTQLGTETQALTRALKGDTKQQGDWGELVLEQLLEHAGLQRDVHFAVQPTFTAADGARLRPDVVVHLPGSRYLVVDSKVSLTAYAELQGAEDDAQRAALTKRHVESVRGHITQLGSKAYDRLHGDRSPDFVVLFLPLEGAFLTALRAEPGLTQLAWDRGVIMVSPSTLLFVVRCVAQLWDTEKRAKNVQDIADRGAALYDKFRGFAEDLQALGKDLDRAHASYRDAMGKLSDGRGSLVRQVELLRELGVQPKRALPPELLERAEGDGPVSS
jgi:DNA recombination protein RmuC